MVANDLFSESLRILVQEDERVTPEDEESKDEEETPPEEETPIEDEVEEEVPEEIPEPADEELVEEEVPEEIPEPADEELVGEEEIDATMIGKVYELKKIHQKLVSISNMIDHFASADFEDLRNYVSKGLELFNIISTNFDTFKDNIDVLISDYYKFLQRVVDRFEKLTNKLEKEKEEEKEG